MTKRIFALLLAVSVLFALAACGEDSAPAIAAAPEQTVAPTPSPEPTPEPEPEIEWLRGSIAVPGAEIIGAVYKRGDTVTVIAEQDNYYIVDTDNWSLLVEKQFIRLYTDGAFDVYEGKLTADTDVFSGAYLDGDPTATLDRGEEVTVLDRIGGILLISCGDVTGYVNADNVTDAGSDEELPWYMTHDWGSGSSSGGGDSGSSSGGGDSGGSSGGSSGGGDSGGGSGGSSGGGQDGGDISLAHIPEGAVIPLDAVKGTVLADGVEGYALIADFGTEIEYLLADDGSILVKGSKGELEINPDFVISEDSEPNEPWQAKTTGRVSAFPDYRMRDEAAELDYGTEVTVVGEFSDWYIIEYEGRHYLVEKDSLVFFDPNAEPEEDDYTDEEIPWYQTYDWGSGGGGDSGSGGGSSGGNSGSGGGGDSGGSGGGEWTEPVL